MRISKVSPTPTDEELAVIAETLDQAWPKPPVLKKQDFPRWRFGSRQWGSFSRGDSAF